MNDNFEKLEQMPVRKAVLSNVIPAMIGMLVILIYNIVDLYFIGQTHDPLQVAAVSVATPIFLILMSIGNIFGVGGASLISRSLGSGNHDIVKNVASFCYWNCIIGGVTIGAIMFFALDPIINILGASDEIAHFVKSYLQYICLSSPFIIMASCYSNLLRAEGQADKAMKGIILGTGINMVLNPVLILWMGLGITGAGMATFIGNACGIVYYFVYLFKGSSALSTKIADYSLSPKLVMDICSIGIPASLATILVSIATTITNSLMANYSDLAVAGIGVTTKVTMLTTMVCIGVGVGVQPLLGYSYGSKNIKRYGEILHFAIIFSFTLSVSLTILCYLGLNHIVGAFLTDPEAFEYAYSFSRVLIATSVCGAVLQVFASALQATGQAKAALIANISRQGIFYIPLVFMMSGFFGLDGIVFAQPIADILALILTIVIYLRIHKKIFSVDDMQH